MQLRALAQMFKMGKHLLRPQLVSSVYWSGNFNTLI